MTGMESIVVSAVNFVSLVLGGVAIGMVFRRSRSGSLPFLSDYLLFLIFAALSGFCDWIVFNWILFLVPGMTPETADSIYHIFWDLIGFPAAVFALSFLILAVNRMGALPAGRTARRTAVIISVVITLLSCTGYFLRQQQIDMTVNIAMQVLFFRIFPLLQLAYLGIVTARSRKYGGSESWKRTVIRLLFLGFLVWHLLSFLPVRIGVWRHLIILAYYLTLFLPSWYLAGIAGRMRGAGIPGAQPLPVVLSNMGLTEREIEVADLIIKGKSNREIAGLLFISLQTVKNYNSRIFQKLQVRNRVGLIRLVTTSGER